jgi:hypothetical protein
MFKWVCLLVAVVALSVFGWMLNDIRLQVHGVTERADKQLDRVDKLTKQLEDHLPHLLATSEKAANTVETHLPTLVNDTETVAEHLDTVTRRLAESRGLLGRLSANPFTESKNKELDSYGGDVLDLVGKQNATIGVQQPGSAAGLRKTMPAKAWAGAHREEAHSLSATAVSKTEMLRDLTRSNTKAPLLIQFGDAAPRLLSDWIRENHPESRSLPW